MNVMFRQTEHIHIIPCVTITVDQKANQFRLGELTIANLTSTALLETEMWEAEGKGAGLVENADSISVSRQVKMIWLKRKLN